MQSIHIELFEQLHTDSYRCFNAVELYFSLDGKLKIQHNGLNKEMYYHVAIINHSDLIKIHHAQALIKVTLPLHLLMELHPTFINGYFDDSKLGAHEHLRDTIQSIITHQDEAYQSKTLHALIQTMLNECYIPCEEIYTPEMQVDSEMFSKVLDIIHHKIKQKVTLQSLAKSFFVSSSYISILFNEQLGFNFKSYTVTLKLSLSLPHLLWSNDSIYDIAQAFGFSNYSNYSKQFKHYIGVSPYTYKKAHTATDSKIIIHHKNSDIFHQLSQNDFEDANAPISINIDAITSPTLFKLPSIRLRMTQLEEILTQQNFFNSIRDILKQQTHYLYFDDCTNVKLSHHKGQKTEQIFRIMRHNHLHFSFKMTSLYDYEMLELHFLNDIRKLTRLIPNFDLNLPSVNILFDSKKLTLKDMDYLAERFQTLFHHCEFEILVPYDIQPNVDTFLQQFQNLKATITGYTFDLSQIQAPGKSNIATLSTYEHLFNKWQQTLSHVASTERLTSYSLIDIAATLSNQISHNALTPNEWLNFIINLDAPLSAIDLPLMTDDTSEFGYINKQNLNTMLPFISELLRPFSHSYVKRQEYAMVKQTDYNYEILLIASHSNMSKEASEATTCFQITSNLIHDKHLVIIRTYDDETMNVRRLIQHDAHTYIPSKHIQAIQKTLHLRQHILIHDFSKGPLEVNVQSSQIKTVQIYKQSTSILNDLD